MASTFGALAAAVALAAAAPWWPLRVVGGLLEALVLVRAFILFHDHMHGSLLRSSPVARALFWLHGVLVLTPPRQWNDTHNYHHANTANLAATAAGTYVTWSTDTWRAASRRERLAYVIERHPLTMLLGYFTAFLVGMCIVPFVRDPRRYWSSGLALLVHLGVSFTVWSVFGTAVYLSAMLVPLLVAYALGTYLFFAQHNFPDVAFRPEGEWAHADAALEASSYLVCSPVMAWFTGNIGYHHIHHLNPRIPFYRLPEAMAALPELQQPRTTTLHPRDVLACLRQNLWDSAQQRMVRYRDVRAAA
ncbi:MAG: fatty acid desaturase [Myxococcaceae bacterium]|nr:fatty acid desaturase [Myxococcaceae bacterium]MCI0669445.1 fatty acid desaturase [Myxococcaceae bacterium]